VTGQFGCNFYCVCVCVCRLNKMKEYLHYTLHRSTGIFHHVTDIQTLKQYFRKQYVLLSSDEKHLTFGLLRSCYSQPLGDKIARSKESNWFRGYCLKTEAEWASETHCFSVYITVTRWKNAQEKKIVSVSYIQSSKPYSVESILSLYYGLPN
jgi:hypothetical protein